MPVSIYFYLFSWTVFFLQKGSKVMALHEIPFAGNSIYRNVSQIITEKEYDVVFKYFLHCSEPVDFRARRASNIWTLLNNYINSTAS